MKHLTTLALLHLQNNPECQDPADINAMHLLHRTVRRHHIFVRNHIIKIVRCNGNIKI